MVALVSANRCFSDLSLVVLSSFIRQSPFSMTFTSFTNHKLGVRVLHGPFCLSAGLKGLPVRFVLNQKAFVNPTDVKNKWLEHWKYMHW